MTERRKVRVPGEDLKVSVILTDAARNRVLAVTVGGKVVVMLTSAVGDPVARLMGEAEFKEFASSVIAAYDALNDDAKIQEMEKEFDG